MKLPNGWLQKTVSDLAEFRNGKAHENIIDDAGKYIVINSKFISSDGKEFKRCKENLAPLFVNDIVMVMSDIPNGKALAKCFLVKDADKYTLNQRICSLRSLDEVSAEYLFYYLNRNKYFLSFDSGVGQTNLRKDEILDCPVSLPPIAEQKRIALIFSVWDRAIETLDKLISAKTRFKKGLMQKLLTGKVRFKDCKSKWIEKKVKNIGKVVSGGTPDTGNPNYWDGTINWCTPTDITALAGRKYFGITSRRISKEGFKNSSATLLPKHSVVVCTRATLGECAINIEEMTTNQGFKSIIPENIHYEFLYYLMSLKKHLLERLGNGSTFLEVSKPDFENIDILVPSEEEQKKIADILSSVDRELDCLTHIQEKLKSQKQGLMQKLLTGKIRVKI